jgi:predicted amidophosphoribosyltransferase
MAKCGCGKDLDTGDINGLCYDCKNPLRSGVRFGSRGWVCPVCGRGNSPFTSTCQCIPVRYDNPLIT